MATVGAFNNGSGQPISFVVQIVANPTGFRTIVTFDDANKDLQCNIYGQLINDPADPIGQQNFVNALASALVQESQSAGAPFDAYNYFSIPGNAQNLAFREATTGEIRKACSWGEAFDPDSNLTITTNADGSSEAQITSSTGLLIAERDGALDGRSTETVYDFDGSQSWSKQISTFDADSHKTSSDVTYDDGSRAASGFDESGFEQWSYQQATDGSGTLTHADGTSVTFEGGANAKFTNNGGSSPQVTIGGDGSQPEVSFGVNPSTGSTSVSMDGGTSFKTPDGSQVSVGADGSVSIEPLSPVSSDWGMGQSATADGGPGASFGDEHPDPLVQRDPLVLDLDGSGIQLTSVASSNAHFDYGNSGFAVLTGWVAPTEGVLVRDIDHDPNTVNANELFGASSGDGFTDLAQMDTNGDGKIDDSDANFSELKVWIDANGDGIADPGEVISLADAGISAINLNPQAAGQHNNGNTIVSTATFVRSNGTPATIAEVNFATNTLYAQYTPPEGFQYSTSAFLLPNLIGYGTVPNLIYSMSLDSTLEDAARELVLSAGSMSGTEFRAAFESLVQQWVGAAGIDPTSDGPRIDARHMSVVEAFYGQTFAEASGSSTVLSVTTAAKIEATYQSILDELEVRFVAQVPLAQLLNSVSLNDVGGNPMLPFAAIKFDAVNDSVDVNFNQLVASIVDHAPQSDADQLAYYDAMAKQLHSLRVDLFHEDSSQLSSAFTAAAAQTDLGPNLRDLVLAEFGSGKGILVSDYGSAVTDTAADDAIIINQGGHAIAGSTGSDTYFFTKGVVGDTTIRDDGSSGPDRLTFVDLNPNEVAVSRPGNSDNVIFTVIATGATLTILDQFLKFATGPIHTEFEEIKFADGTLWTPDDIRTHLLASEKTPGNDTIYGFYTGDVLDGGAGDDTLVGNGGGDTFVWGHGYGHDTIDAYIGYITRNQPDTLAFTSDVAPEALHLARDGDDLTITIAGSDDSVTILGQFGSLGYSTIESFTFANGTTWTWIDVQNKFLVGTGGDDTLTGFVTADVLDGGAGNDTLVGGGGGDTYVFGLGYGHDTVNAYIGQLFYNQPDTVQFGTGITPDDITLTRDNDNLTISVDGSSDQLTILSQFSNDGYSRVESFTFADGTTWTWQDVQLKLLTGTPGNDLLIGYGGDDRLDGGAGDDVLKGGAGDDTYVFGRGYGHDTIDDNNENIVGNAPDSVEFGPNITPADLTFEHYADDLLVFINGTSDQLTISKYFNPYFTISNFRFADGTVLTESDITAILNTGRDPNVTHLGTAAPETINGSSGDDVIDGLGGDDILNGGNGNDTYYHRGGSGNDTINDWTNTTDVDTLRLFGVTPDQVRMTHSGTNLLVQRLDTNEIITVTEQFHSPINGIEQIAFDDGTTWDRSYLASHAVIIGTSGNDNIGGTSGDEIFSGGAGNDYINGSSGSDTYLYARGDGSDTLDEDSTSSTDADVLRFTDLNPADVQLTRSGVDVYVEVLSTGDRVRLVWQLHGPTENWGMEQIHFADDTVWDRDYIATHAVIRGTSGNDNLSGTSGNDIFSGGTGNDFIDGGAGSDTFLYARGDGSDTLDEDSTSSTDDDVLKFADLNPADVQLTRSGVDVYVEVLSTGDRIRLVWQLHGPTENWGVEQIHFANDTIWDRDYIASHAVIRGTSGVDNLTGTSGNDILDGLGGNDTLNGGAGSDTYLYYAGAGNDTIAENTDGAATDTVQLVGLNAADVNLSRGGDDLFITLASSGEVLKVQGHFASTTTGIEQIAFADGYTMDRSAIMLALAVNGTSGADTLNGTNSADVLAGLGGNDTIFGHAGNDVLIGGIGNDTLSGDGGDDTYMFNRGDGQDLIKDWGSDSWGGNDTVAFGTGITAADLVVTEANSGNDLVIALAGTSDQITIYQDATGNSDYRIEQFTFADGSTMSHAQIMALATVGTSGNDTIYGDENANTIIGGAGDDTLYGRQGNDTLIGGPGNDTLSGDGNDDTYVFNIGDGHDTIREWGSNSWGGNDQIQFGAGITAASLTVTEAANGNDLIITLNAADSITIINDTTGSSDYRVEQVRFDDGSTLSHAQLMNLATIGTSGNDTIYGDENANTITGGAGSDTLYGRQGNDTLAGGPGNDTLSGDGNDDTYVFGVGDGHDTIREFGSNSWGGNDTLQFSPGITAADLTVTEANSGSDLVITLSSGDSITIVNDTTGNSDYRVEQARFDDGSILSHAQLMNLATTGTSGNDALYGDENANTMTGAAGNDTLDGRAGNDSLEGGAGNDTMTGGSGNDTFIFHAGSGQDIITDFTAGAGAGDVIQFDSAIFASYTAVMAAASQVGNDVNIAVDANTSILLQHVALANLAQDDFHFV